MNLAAQILVSNGIQVAGIWVVLIGLAVASLMALNAERPHSAQAQVARFAEAVSDHLEQRREERVRQAEQAAYAARYAREIVVVAQTATATVQHRRDQWQEAQQQLDAEWEAYRAADERVAHTVRAAAFDSHSVAYLPVHFAARERYLHTAATEAHRRGELSGAQLVDAMAHRNGWNPCLHPADQDVVLARAARTNLYRNYQRAVAAERAAWHEAEVAVVAARTLRSEAGIAAHLSTPRVAVPRQRVGAAFASLPSVHDLLVH